MYPAGLTEEARESYEAYIREYALPAAEHLTDTEDMAALREFSARRLWSEEALNGAIGYASEQGRREVLSFLMNEKHRLFPGGRKNMNYEMAGTTTEQLTGGISEQAAERLEQIGREILGICRDELYFSMRFLDVALSSFVYVMTQRRALSGRTDIICISIPGNWAVYTGRTGSLQTGVIFIWCCTVFSGIYGNPA